MEETPLVSIVIPCYNDAEYLEEALDSVLGQTYGNQEIIVVNDGSNDETRKLIEGLYHKIDTLIHQAQLGVSAARNNGIAAAKGEYIAILDSDDFFEPEFCEKAVFAFQEDVDIKIVTSYGRIFGNVLEPYIYKPRGGKVKSFLKENSALAVCFRKEDWIYTGGYDEDLKKGFEDWEFYIRLLKDGGSTFVIPEPLFNYRRKINSRSTVANDHRFDLLKYIYLKHQELYKEHFELLVAAATDLAKFERRERNKIRGSLEWKIGNKILAPYYKLRSFLRFFK